MSLASATAKTTLLADAAERATRAAKAFPSVPAAPGPAGAGGRSGFGLAELQDALAPLVAGLDSVIEAVTDTTGAGFLMARRFGG